MRYVFPVLLLVLMSACSAEDENRAMTASAPGSESIPAMTPAPGVASFRMIVMDVFPVAGSGPIVTGVINSGSVAVGDTVCIESAKIGARQLLVGGIESLRTVLDSAGTGDDVALIVSGIERDDVSRGDVLSSTCAD